MTPGDLNDAELLRLALASAFADVHVCAPGRVESYDAATQRADVRPMLKRLVASATVEDGTVAEPLPVIPSVPVAWPSGGGFSITFPLAVGDFVLLVFADADPAAWLSTGTESAPADHRRHSLANAFAIPCVRPSARPITSASASDVVIAKDDGLAVHVTPTELQVGGASDAAALASLVTQMQTVLLDAIAGAVPVPNDGGAGLQTTLLNGPAGLLTVGWPVATASTILKVGG